MLLQHFQGWTEPTDTHLWELIIKCSDTFKLIFKQQGAWNQLWWEYLHPRNCHQNVFLPPYRHTSRVHFPAHHCFAHKFIWYMSYPHCVSVKKSNPLVKNLWSLWGQIQCLRLFFYLSELRKTIWLKGRLTNKYLYKKTKTKNKKHIQHFKN